MSGTAPAASEELAGGNYEVIRRRLGEAARELARRAGALNDRRKATFGGTELSVLGQGRVRTENNGVPVGICQVGGRLLFGYNVFLGLRRDMAVGDLFSLHALEAGPDGFEFPTVSADDALYKAVLGDPTFAREFGELFQTWRDARLRQLRIAGGKLLAVLQVGRTLKDVRVFRWALSPSGPPTYLDNRGERDHTFPAPFDFTWTRSTRESQVEGRFPHVSILDEIFVETTGGDLTIKVENNTATGKGIYSEPVQDPNQSLDDAEIWYARLGALILLKVLPFQESAWRYLVYNRRTGTVTRIDAIGLGCQTLPEDQGVIFPGGIYLQTGEHKLFDGDMAGLEIKRVVRSPNGEDVLYVFYRPGDGAYLLLPYNLIRKAVATPILSNGYTLFDDGRLVVFRAAAEPGRVHPMQVWQTPFTSDEHAAAQPRDASFLGRLGNAELVRGLSDVGTLVALAEAAAPTRTIYEDLIAAAGRLRDAYHWLGHAEVGDLLSAIDAVRRTAELIVDEFEKVLALRARATASLDEAREKQTALLATVRPEDWRGVEEFMAALTALRQQRGHLITIREVRFIDGPAIDALEAAVVEASDRVSREVVGFLGRPDALAPLRARIEGLHAALGEARKAADFKPLDEQVGQIGAGLDLVAEVVGGLQVGDATARASALEDISETYGLLNRARAALASRRAEVVGAESRAEFAAQYKLLGQAVQSALALCDSPERADEQLSRLLLLLEELEGRFGEIDEFSAELGKKREEVVEALGARKQTLLDERQRRVGNLVAAGERILEGVARRARGLKTEDELNATFASDPMVLKLRQLAEQLKGQGDTVKSEELLGRLKSTWQTALRALRDRLDLFDGGDNLVRFGRFKFTVNTQPIELALVPRGEQLCLHLSGTDFYEPLTGPEVEQSRPLWSQTVVSETDEVARAEFLAASLLFDAEAGRRGSVAELSAAALREGGLLEIVRAAAAERYDEGYERGIHDHDAALILARLLDLRGSAGLLRFPSLPRAAAALFWAWLGDRAQKEVWHRSARSLGRIGRALGPSPAAEALARDLAARIDRSARELRLHEILGEAWGEPEAALAGRYLVEELAADRPRFVVSPDAVALKAALHARLEQAGGRSAFEDDLRALEKSPAERLALALAWVGAAAAADPALAPLREAVTEAAVSLVTERDLDQEPSSARTSATVTGLLGQHPLIRGGQLELRLDAFLSRLTRFLGHRAPAFRAWRERKANLIAAETRRLRLSEFKPRIMTSFVRNRLISEVYLPLIGANLAKQLGAAGEGKRTDLMGLLLLISPPGYGKTTLMEYVAGQLGLVFVKVNGPALGHGVTSLDPSEAPNATSRQEVERVNLALEMGNNAMLYLDDIQHTNPELLQKFISLCDAQRKIEGVWRGTTRTYDLRGKKFCVVMAGNPYTESGEKFQIPDMLANRADTYNLGDILEGRDDLFALSYLENALTSNPALAPLAARPASDIDALLRMAKGEEVPSSALSAGLSAVEIAEIVGVFRHLFRVQATLLKVNLEYIRSASMSDAFRTEPPFKLQGSYRNMGKLTEKVVAAMTEAEVERLIDDHYQGESQTLTSGAEQNLLKLAELRGRQSPEQAARWDEVKRAYARVQLMGGNDADPVTRVTGTLTGLGQQLEGIKGALAAGTGRGLEERLAGIVAGLEGLRAALDPASREKLTDPLRLVAAQVQGLKNAVVEGKGAAPVAASVGALGAEVAGLRRGVEAATAGLAALNLTDWLIPQVEQIRSEADVAKLQGAMMESAMAALGDPNATPLERRDIALASALPVIHSLAVQIHDLSGSHLPPAAREAFMDALRVEFARVIAALSGLAKEG